MRNKILIVLFLLAIPLIIQSCCFLMDTGDETFSFSRVEDNSAKLRLNGYYYGDVEGNFPDHPELFLLNQNGVFCNENGREGQGYLTGDVDFFNTPIRTQHKSYWGIYKINGNDIEIEYWEPAWCTGHGLTHLEGVIVNDTTFLIKYWKYIENGSKKEEGHVDAIFKFHQYSPKPDSVVSFIP
jgi:hypothetical protein